MENLYDPPCVHFSIFIVGSEPRNSLAVFGLGTGPWIPDPTCASRAVFWVCDGSLWFLSWFILIECGFGGIGGGNRVG